MEKFNNIWPTVFEMAKERAWWPQPAELILHTGKIQYLMQLAHIAEHVTKTSYPRYHYISDPDSVDWTKTSDLVVKRGFSRTVLSCKPQKPIDTLREIWEQIGDQYTKLRIGNSSFRVPFFSMPYLQAYSTLGEISAFFIGGKLVYRIAAIPDEVGNKSYMPVKFITPLHLI